MKDLIKNKKFIYAIIAIIILLGIATIGIFKLNFTLIYKENTKINIYIGKEYNLDDIKAIIEEVFAAKEVNYQKIERFEEAISVTVEQATDEQIENLKTKIKEKYEIESIDGLIKINKVSHLRGIEILKPFIIPILVATIIVVAYVGVRYIKLGISKVIFTLLLRTIIVQALLLSAISICRIPIGIFTMSVVLLVYVLTIFINIVKFQNELEKKIAENKKK